MLVVVINLDSFLDNSSPWHNARRRLRQDIINARRDSVGRIPGNSGGPVRLPMAALRSRHITTERILLREGLRRERRDRYRFVVDYESFAFCPRRACSYGPSPL